MDRLVEMIFNNERLPWIMMVAWYRSMLDSPDPLCW